MLQITGLTHRYGPGAPAVDDITLDVPRGMFGLLGPNGAGKSTLMRCLATLQVPSAGRIVFDGLDVLAAPARLRAQLGYLPQDFGVPPRVSALALLDHLAVLKGLADRGARRAEVEARLQQVNLWSARHQAVAGYSGGMRQRFGIAQALLGQPRLVIVDEPTAGLDPEERNRFNDLLAEIGEQTVVILSTHIVDDVTDLCPRAAILVQGRLVRQGTPAELITALDGRVWVGRVPREAVEAWRERWPVLAVRRRAGEPVLHVLADACPGPGFSPQAAGLEDVYFATLLDTRGGHGAAPAGASA